MIAIVAPKLKRVLKRGTKSERIIEEIVIGNFMRGEKKKEPPKEAPMK